MAKRVRGGSRPGQRRPQGRRPAASASASAAPAASAAGAAAPSRSTAPRPAGLTADEVSRAAELEEEVLAQEREADASRSRAKARSSRESFSGGTTLAGRTEAEYAYVARDLRQIGEMAAIMLTILILLWVMIDVVKVIPVG